MASTIITKNGTSGAPSSLTAGELAINTTDGGFYYGSTGGTSVSSSFKFGNITASAISASGNITASGLSASGGTVQASNFVQGNANINTIYVPIAGSETTIETTFQADNGTVGAATLATAANTVKTIKNNDNATMYPVFVDSNNTTATAEALLTSANHLTYNPNTGALTVAKIGAFTAAGAIDFSDENMTNVDIDSGTIDGTDVTVGSGKTLDVSAGTLTTSAAQKQAIVGGADGAAIDNCVIGATTAAAGTFTNLTATGDTTLGNAITDEHTIQGHITASGAISASGMIQTAGAISSSTGITASNAFFSNDITSSGDISASGDVYSNNIEPLCWGGLVVDRYGRSQSSYFDPAGNVAAANDWWGLTDNFESAKWTKNYGDDTQVQTLPSHLAPISIAVPYKCQLVGFKATVVHDPGWAATVGTITFAVYSAAGDAATFNNTSADAAPLTLTQRVTATTGTPDQAGNPMTLSVTNGTTALDAGDLLFLRIKSSTASDSSANDIIGNYTILIKRAK